MLVSFLCHCVVILVPLGVIWQPGAPQGTPPGSRVEKVTKKSPILNPSTCLNLVRGLKKSHFSGFRKRSPNGAPKASLLEAFWALTSVLWLPRREIGPILGGLLWKCFFERFFMLFWVGLGHHKYRFRVGGVAICVSVLCLLFHLEICVFTRHNSCDFFPVFFGTSWTLHDFD